MNEQQILDELLALLETNGITVRSEPLGGGGGGLCAVKGENIFFRDSQSSPGEVAMLCARAVGTLIDVETIYIRPEVREFIKAQCATGRG